MALSRRTFLKTLLESGVKSAPIPLVLKALMEAEAASGNTPAPKMREVCFFDRLDGGFIRCGVCPNTCMLGDGQTGRCRARTNHGGTHYNHAYGNPCILSVDPIEKLPLNHFLPGTDTVCIATGGCNLRCLYCQNYEWSQIGPEEVRRPLDLGPGEAVHAVLKKEISTIAFLYTDPIAYFEYACDIADIARRSGLRSVAATNGYALKPTIRMAADKMDAIVVGLKGFDDEYYRAVCGGRLKPVLDAIVEIQSHGGCWIELTTLIVPTYNDGMKEIKAMARWIRKNAGAKVPWHIARFIPRYKLANVPRTPIQTLDEARKIALDEGLQYVYTSNIAPHEGNNTFCPRCNRKVIERIGFKVLGNDLKGDRCTCGERLEGRFPSLDR